MASWLFSGAVFACVWGCGFLVAMHSRGRLREGFAPAGILVASSIWLGSGALFLSGNAPAFFFGIHLPAGFLIGPLVLVYARFILRSSESLRLSDVIHALPSFAAIVCLVWYHALSPEDQSGVMRMEGSGGTLFALLNAGLKVSVLGYTFVVSVWFFRLIPRESRYLPLLFFYGAVIADLLIGIAGFASGHKTLILVSAAGLPPILYGCFLAACRWPDMLGSLRADVTRRRYQKTRLLGLDVEGTVDALRRLMEEEKAFSDEDLTLAALARELQVTPHQLSQILNERLEKSFSAYINEYRIREARDLIVKEPERSLLSIGHAAGFNSKSAFNRAFRQVCGETPQQFRASQKILSRLDR